MPPAARMFRRPVPDSPGTDSGRHDTNDVPVLFSDFLVFGLSFGMKFWIGTSGFQYAEWKGNFYPEDLPTAKMLPFYAERFSTTEINYTFHRIPAPKTIENWKTLTPEEFRFALKAPQRITHWSKLRDCADTLEYFLKIAGGLSTRLGAILFQLPPNFKKDSDALRSFLRELPSLRAAFEFRHASWFDDEIFHLLGARNIALCIADTDALSAPKKITADYGYLRLRREDYTKSDIARWAAFLRAQKSHWKDAFVYFKHEARGIGPKLARQTIELLA
jgi:uncharacterized protein YecE (DUF72 family)